jgi:DNA (cytosine-5)-methyltransferase 1
MAEGLGAGILVMENVLGLRRVNGVGFESRILKCFARSGYKGRAIEVDASDYGVPQRRRRLIFICADGRYDAACFELQPIGDGAQATVAQALGDLPAAVLKTEDMPRANGKPLFNHRAMVHSKKVIEKIQAIKPGQGPISYRRLQPDLARTIIAGHRAMPVHPSLDRTITVREAARLQTMPDAFRFLGPHSEQPLQVANVVPYCLSRAIARGMHIALNAQARRKE